MVNQKERKQSYLVDIKLLPLLLMGSVVKPSCKSFPLMHIIS